MTIHHQTMRSEVSCLGLLLFVSSLWSFLNAFRLAFNILEASEVKSRHETTGSMAQLSQAESLKRQRVSWGDRWPATKIFARSSNRSFKRVKLEPLNRLYKQTIGVAVCFFYNSHCPDWKWEITALQSLSPCRGYLNSSRRKTTSS